MAPPASAKHISSAQGVLFLDEDLRVRDADVDVARLLGTDPGSLRGKRLHEVLVPAHVERTAAGDDEIPVGVPMALLRADGTRIPVEGMVRDGADGLAIVVMGPISDDEHGAGARRERPPRPGLESRREATLVEQLQRAQRLAGVGSWEWDVEADQISWSKELHRIYGTDPETFEASFEAFISLIHPEDRDDLQAHIQSAMESGKDYTVDHRIVRPDGVERRVHGMGAVELDDEGKPTLLYGIAQDVTRQEEIERNVEVVLASAPDPIIMCDEEETVTFANDRVADVFGVTPDELRGRSIRTILAGTWEEAMESPPGEEPIHLSDVEGLHADGRHIPIDAMVSRAETRQGPVFIAALRDVTERRKAEEADRLAFERLMEIQQLRELDRAKTTILNTASHELKTPMTPLRLQLYLLEQEKLGPLTPRQSHAIRVLRRNTDRLSALIADVLDMARIESGRLDLDKAVVPVATVVRETEDTFEEALRDAKVTLVADIPPELTVFADQNRCAQILINLVSNAIKFSPEGSKVHVRAEDDGDFVRIEVQDEGIGIPLIKQRQLFTPFGQVHEEGKVNQRGTGLGLYICKGIIEQHGGEIGLMSEGDGRGSTFWFRLPSHP